MPPAFRHGKNSRLIISTIDASSLFNEMTMSHSVDTAEVTTFNTNDRSYITGQRDGTFSASGFLDATTAGTGDPFAKFRGALGSTAFLQITGIQGAPGGSTVTPGSMCHMAAGVVTGFETAAPAMGVVTAKFDAQVSDRYDIGRTLYGPGAAKTSTFVGTSVSASTVSASGTPGGGVSHFHIVNASTVTSVTIKVQHSSATVWTDLATFTSTSTGVSRVASTGTIKRHVRTNITAFTGGAGKSVKIVVAFARRGAVA